MKMGGVIPSQCPNCRAIAIEVTNVPPHEHDEGDEWQTHAECMECEEYAEWIDDEGDGTT